MKKIFELTNKYIIIATPLLLFLFFLSIYLFVIMQSGRLLIILFGLFLVAVMIVAFTAGWGNMVKSAASENNPDEPYLIIKDFAPGVGEYFLPSLGFWGISFAINTLFLILAYVAGMHFIGDVGISADGLTKAMASNAALKEFLTSLSTTQLMKLKMWNLLILSVMGLVYFLLLFYAPAVFLENKNPFKALFLSLKHTFSKSFFSVLGIYILIFGTNFFISILSAFFAGNIVMSFVMTLVNFYFICLVVVGIFYYYLKTFIDSHLGNTIDTYV